MVDEIQRRAQERMALRGTEEARMAQEGQQNAGGQVRYYDNGEAYYDSAPLSEYPRMMYRKTDREITQEWADAVADLKDKPLVINRFDGLLCETTIANDANEAELLADDGWDVSAKAAHGMTDGLQAVATAKDDRIRELEAMLAARDAVDTIPKRGRPPKVVDDVMSDL